MTNYVAPQVLAPYDEDIAGILQEWVAGVTGIPGQYVRPRYQAQPPSRPPPSVNFADVYLNQKPASDYPFITVEDDGTSVLHRYEELDILISFYGPNTGQMATTLRDGAYAPVNIAALAERKLTLVEVGMVTGVPDLINSQFISRNDVTVKLIRFVNSILPDIGTIISADVILTHTAPTGSEVVTAEAPSEE